MLELSVSKIKTKKKKYGQYKFSIHKCAMRGKSYLNNEITLNYNLSLLNHTGSGIHEIPPLPTSFISLFSCYFYSQIDQTKH